MIWKRLNEPLTPKLALRGGVALLLGAVLGLGLWGVFQWTGSGSLSPRRAKAAIWKHLKKQAGRSDFKADYDFDLRATVAEMQTNLVRLKALMGGLQTNVATLRKETVALRGDLTKLQGEERALVRQVRGAEADLAEKQRRLTQREQELSAARTDAFRQETNVVALRKEAGALEAGDGQMTNDQKTPSQKLRRLQGDLKTGEARLESLNASAAAVEKHVLTAQTNVNSARNELAAQQDALTAKQKELAAKESVSTAKQQELTRVQADLEAKQKDLAAQQRDVAAKEQLLAHQLAVFSRGIRKEVAEAVTYEPIYRGIGQQLWVADRLLRQAEADRQRGALSLAREAAEYALSHAEDAWLAARICVGYLWPNLDLADPKDKPRANADQLLQVCQNVFQQADEPENLIRNYRLRLKYVTHPRQEDSIRYYLAYALEQAGELKEAATLYRQVTSTNLLRHAERRLAAVEQRLRAKPASSP